jgi:hypothetical protein
MIENGQEVYIVQINMAEPDQTPDWDNMGVYQDYQQALTHIDWCKVVNGRFYLTNRTRS